MLTIGIAGAGLLGRLLAWRLSLAGHRVILCDKNPAHSQSAAAFTAAGMVSPLSELAVSERQIYDLGLRSMQLWPRWLEQLNARHLYSKNGSLVLAHAQDQAELAQFHNDLKRRLVQEPFDADTVSQAQIKALEPQLAHFQQGIFLPEESHLDNRQLLPLLCAAIVKLGGRLLWDCAIAFDNTVPTADSMARLQAHGISHPIDLWLDTRGVGAKQSRSSVRGVRGEVMAVHTPEITLRRPVRLMHPRYQLYIVPKADQHFVIGATQIESEDLSPISLQSTLELASALYTVHPAFGEARVVESPTNLRPSLPDNLPIAEKRGQYLFVNGLFRHGYLLAPAVCERIEHLLKKPLLPDQWRADFTSTGFTEADHDFHYI
ncbi:glycine oxidase ThiO [Simiduia agarivorans]|uniref:ATP-dependent DNA helicase RecQ n=1 Tax=Simiduia agarivorans (strain DSM 21679 / JCM 13881 / BCRC 17597 / SA1) TaxID=1117647 RepID=K4L434_SIMAS|nr:glycine oxidase ThiO [Simiduia agarivorans]AFV00978.1 ATP-dependent DNA helicase RecQ [Simiduia agarivorans SA1 = DSM 21679]